MNDILKTRTTPIGAWPAIHLSNDLISLSVVPSIGGRVMDLRLGETNLFYANQRHYGKKQAPSSKGTDIGMWLNYGGSKVWPAPQGWASEQEWPGPPDPVLDSGLYDARVLSESGSAGVRLKSEPDEYSGITLERDIEISPGTSIVHLHHTMRNTSKRPVRWSIWQVTQMDAAKGLNVFIPANGFRQTLGDKPYPKIALDSSSKQLRLQYENQVAKFAVEASQGWIASHDPAREIVLAETFPIVPGAPYPDDAPAALWVNGAGTFTIHGDQVDMNGGINGCDPHVETEIMGPITNLEPGQTAELKTAWRLAAIRSKEILSVKYCGAVGQKLVVDSSRASGSFGVFLKANLALLAYDRKSQIVGRFPFGAVSPLRPVVLDEKISLPSDAVRCSLVLFDERNHRLGILDHVKIR